MNYLSLLSLLSLLHFSCGWTPFSGSSPTSTEKVLLHQVDKIVLRDGHMTNSRRVSAIPQLRCVGGTAGCSSLPSPNLVVCSNAGRDRNDPTWQCEADFDNKYKFGRIKVSCEGYEYPEDPYVLKDSCGLEYEIDYDNSHTGSYGYNYSSHESSFSVSNLLVVLAICLLVYGIYRNTLGAGEEREGAPSTSSHSPGASSHPSGTSSPGTSSSSPHSSGTSSHSSGASCSGASSSSTYSPGATGGWGNFLSGMFVGGIANSVFSMISSLFRPRYGYGTGYGSGYGNRGGYGYGGFGGARRGYTGGMGSWGGSSSGGGTSRKSGFGGTDRR